MYVCVQYVYTGDEVPASNGKSGMCLLKACVFTWPYLLSGERRMPTPAGMHPRVPIDIGDELQVIVSALVEPSPPR